MNRQSTHWKVTRLWAVLLLIFVAACAAPIPPGSQVIPDPPSPSIDETTVEIDITKTIEPTTEPSEQILEPLLTVSEDGSIQSGLALTWSSQTTVDGKFTEVDFLLSSDLPAVDNNTLTIEDVAVALQQMADLWPDDPGNLGAGIPGGNPCINADWEPLSVLAETDGHPTISVIVPRSEECVLGDDNACTDPVFDWAANVPVFDHDVFTHSWRTEAGLLVLEGATGMVKWDPVTRTAGRCTGPECEKPVAPKVKPTCTPKPKK